MDKLVSIVVPVYNVSKYIDECVASLVNQSYHNIEILLVNDGSKDNSGELCDAWAERDSRVRVIHKQNGGAASARNAAIDLLNGQFVCFLDGDDTVEPNHIELLIDAVEEYNADAAAGGFYYWTPNEKKENYITEIDRIYSRDDFMLLFLKDWTCALTTNKIFSRDIIGDIRYDEGHKVDDEFFTYQVCMNCQRIAVITPCLYNYRMRSSSVMQDNSPEIAERYMLDRIAYNTDRYNNVSRKMPHIAEEYFANTIDSMARYWHHSKDMPTAQKQIRKWINNHFFRLLFSKHNVKQKIIYIKSFYFHKPCVVGEPITIVPSDDCFE